MRSLEPVTVFGARVGRVGCYLGCAAVILRHLLRFGVRSHDIREFSVLLNNVISLRQNHFCRLRRIKIESLNGNN